MTEERLKESIKQGATIYRIDEGVIIEMGLANEIAEIYGDMLYYQDGIWWYIKDLFETKEQAEWHLKTYACRFELFEPPMWEEIESGVKDGYTFCFIGKDEYFYCFCVEKERINQIYMNYEMNVHNEVFDMEATKENYEKACEIVRDLFRGEE